MTVFYNCLSLGACRMSCPTDPTRCPHYIPTATGPCPYCDGRGQLSDDDCHRNCDMCDRADCPAPETCPDCNGGGVVQWIEYEDQADFFPIPDHKDKGGNE